jgi:hypothetical protein
VAPTATGMIFENVVAFGANAQLKRMFPSEHAPVYTGGERRPGQRTHLLVKVRGRASWAERSEVWARAKVWARANRTRASERPGRARDQAERGTRPSEGPGRARDQAERGTRASFARRGCPPPPPPSSR